MPRRFLWLHAHQWTLYDPSTSATADGRTRSTSSRTHCNAQVGSPRRHNPAVVLACALPGPPDARLLGPQSATHAPVPPSWASQHRLAASPRPQLPHQRPVGGIPQQQAHGGHPASQHIAREPAIDEQRDEVAAERSGVVRTPPEVLSFVSGSSCAPLLMLQPAIRAIRHREK